MAQVSIPPSPAAVSRRTPLTNIPNAINSSFQMSTSTSAKRSRSVQRDVTFGQPPPKKQAVESALIRTPARRSQQVVDTTKPVAPSKRVISRTRSTAGQPPTFVDINQQPRKTTVTRPTAETHEHQNEDVKAWQRHYRKAFPTYVFFFENIPQDVLAKAQKQIEFLGAKYEKYFSAKVTHLITNRTLPQEGGQSTSATRLNSKSTVTPSLLEQKADGRRAARGNTDILLKAREYGMKIWATEKLDRVLNVLFEYSTNRPSLTVPTTKETTTRSYSNAQQNDLSYLLRNEKLHGPSDRDPTVATKDIQFWKGPYIYIHDMFGVHRPIILREYAKVTKRDDGDWPQFRSVSGGKCPFIEEHVHQRRERDRREKAEPVKVERTTRATAAKEPPKAVTVSPSKVSPTKQRKPVKEEVVSKERSPVKARTAAGKSKRILTEIDTATDNRTNSRTTAAENISSVPKRSAKTENAIAFTGTNESNSQLHRRCNVEPAASGVQPSNITSAIRSQMISSHHDQPAQRAGTSKELHALQRKVAGNVLLGNPVARASMARRSTDLLAKAAENDAKASRKREHEPLAKIAEDCGGASQRKSQEVKAKSKPDPKPGYCENCREKFDDFEEHTYSRQHRKFATNNKNWQELDLLLLQLRRPLKGTGRRYQ